MTTTTFTTPGTTSWRVPSGVTSVRVQCWGGGGDGGFGSSADSASSGGGGEYAEEPSYTTTPGNLITVVVGSPGTDTSFDGFVVAHTGGNAGAAFSPGSPGSGSTNTIHHSGGSGGDGFPGQQFGNHAGGAGGAGGAGSGGAGGAGPNGTTNSFPPGGTGGSPDGGAGGAGAPFPASGNDGFAPGGGGGGGGSITAPSITSGGSGAPGQIILTYTSSVVVAAQTAVISVRALTGSVSSSLALPGPAGAVTVAALAGTVTASSVAVQGPAAIVTVTGFPGAVGGPPVSLTAPPGIVTVTGLAGAVAVTGSGPSSSRAEVASLVIGGQVELLGGGVPSQIPACAGARFMLAPGYDLGTQQPVVDITAELITDGERPFGRRSGNRTLQLPIVIQAGDLATLTAARETLIALVDQPVFTVTWTRDGGLPMVLDCFRAMASAVPYSVRTDRQFVCEVTLTFQALPYGRSDIPQQLTFASPVIGSPAPPPSPVLLDDYETVSGDNWSASTSRITGSLSAHWSSPSAGGFFGFFGFTGGASAASYTSTFDAVSIAGRTVLQHWAGFASPSYYYYWQSQGMVAQFSYVLRDASGRALSFGTSVSSVTPSAGSTPNWIQVSAAIPSTSHFDYSNVVSCQITITNGGGVLANTDAWLDDLTVQPVTTGSVATVRGTLYTLHGIQGTSHAPLALQFEQPTTPGTSPPPFRTLIAHRPGPDSPATLTPFVSTAHVSDPPDGRQYAVTSQVAGVNARFSGTYSVVAVANSWADQSASRTVTITVWETEYPGGPSSSQSVSRTFTPSTDIQNGLLVVGEITLPGKDIPPDNTAMFHTVGITDTMQDDQFLDVLFLDTMGQTVIINESQAYSVYYLDEPDPTRDLGRILGSSTDRSRAVSVLDSAFVSGGPLTVEPLPSVSQLFVYAVEGAPSLIASFYARWFLDRLS